MSETALRRAVINMLKPLHGVSVENPAYPGFPDVNYIEGLIELKVVDRWPPRDGIIQVEHFTPQQRVFLRTRWRLGGRCAVLLRVKREWLLFDGDTGANMVGRANKCELLHSAAYHWIQKPSSQEFRTCLLRISPKVKSSLSRGDEQTEL